MMMRRMILMMLMMLFISGLGRNEKETEEVEIFPDLEFWSCYGLWENWKERGSVFAWE